MRYTDISNQLLFEYESFTLDEIRDIALCLPRKLQRWLGTYHPDNRIRRIFFELTGVKVGEDSVINIGFIVSDGYLPLLTIGERVAISPNVTIICQSGPNNSLLKDIPYVHTHLVVESPVFIGDDVWIGSNAVILPNVTVGPRAIIGAGAIVTINVPPNAVVSGVPARIKRYIQFNSK